MYYMYVHIANILLFEFTFVFNVYVFTLNCIPLKKLFQMFSITDSRFSINFMFLGNKSKCLHILFLVRYYNYTECFSPQVLMILCSMHYVYPLCYVLILLSWWNMKMNKTILIYKIIVAVKMYVVLIYSGTPLLRHPLLREFY